MTWLFGIQHTYRIYKESTGLAGGPYRTNQHRRRPRTARGDLARCRGTCHWCCLTIPIGHSGWSIMTVYTHWIVPSIDDGLTASSTYSIYIVRGLYKYSNINRITITYLYRLCTTCDIRKEMPLYYCPASDVRRVLFIFADFCTNFMFGYSVRMARAQVDRAERWPNRITAEKSWLLHFKWV